MDGLTLSEKIWLAASAIVLWLAGETGRAIVAGAAGGLLRWLAQERRRVRDGVVSVTGGMIASVYLGPVVAAVLTAAGSPISDPAATGFIAGLAGMSLAKVIVAIVEAQAARMVKGRDQ